MLKWTAKADAATQIISWLGLVVAGLIMVTWLVKSDVFMPVDEIEILDQDLLHIQLMIDDACNSIKYKNTYNPLTEQGNLSFKNNEVCVTISPSGDIDHKITRCINPICNLGLDISVDLTTITNIGIIKNETFKVIEQ